MFADVPYFTINREERHFGFLFLAALATNSEARANLVDYINTKIEGTLDHRQIDVYAEVSLFRDYWRALGNPSKYTSEIHSQRMRIFVSMLETLGINPASINNEPVFWTGKPGDSKLFYPGKWSKDKINSAERRLGLVEKQLWRLRWACNAKPDIMIEDPTNTVFIEIKVESGFGNSKNGYSQLQTQHDILLLGEAIIPSLARKQIELTTLTQDGNGLIWPEVTRILGHPHNESLFSMVNRHLKSMPS
jgi:hypothetical protein